MRNKKLNIICIILIIIFTISIATKVIPEETLSSIKIGQDILKYGIGIQDRYCNFENLKYINLHWLFDVIVGSIYNNFSLEGIYIFTIIISSIIGISLFYILRKKTDNNIISFFVTLITIFLLNKDTNIQNLLRLNTRVFGYLILLFEIFVIEQFIKTGRRKYLVVLFINSIILLNINATMWPLYFLLYIPYLIESVLAKIFENKNKEFYKIEIQKNNKNNKKLIIFFVFLLLTGFVNPIGGNIFLYLIKTLIYMPYKYINELSPIIVSNSIAFVSINIMCISIFTFTKIKVKISDCMMVFLLNIITIFSAKNIVLLVLISGIIITKAVIDFIKLYPESNKQIEEFLVNKKVFCVIVLIVLLCVGYNCLDRRNEGFLSDENPTEIIDYIKTNFAKSDIKIYNDILLGDYLIFNNLPVFVDSRYEMYCKKINNSEIFDDYVDVNAGEVSYKEIFEKYGINLVLINKNGIINNFIQKDEEYLNVCEEENYILYKK